MKNLFVVICTALFLCSACTKIKVLPPTATNFKDIESTSTVQSAEKLKSALTGTHVALLIEPLYPNLILLFSTSSNSNNDSEALIIDKAFVNVATPNNSFRCVAANLQL